MTPKRFALLIFVAAFAVRLVAVLAMRDIHKFHGNQLGADAIEFNQLGLSLARDHSFQLDGKMTAFRAVGFPLYLSVLYSIFGESYPPQYIGLGLMGALTCVLTYFVAQELGT